MYQVQFDPLPNGVMRIYAPMAGHRRVTVAVGFRSGSVDDPPGQEGLAHLLEHARLHAAGVFDSWRALARQWDRCCYDVNAETDKTTTLIYAQTIDRYLVEAMTLFGPVVHEPRLETPQVETEKQRIFEERREDLDRPDEVLNERLDGAMFAGWRISRSVIGTELSVRSLTIRDLRELHRLQSAAARLVVVVAGGFKPDTIRPQLERLFGKLPIGTRPNREHIDYTALSGRIEIEPRELEQVHFILGFPAFDFNDPDVLVLGAIRNYLSVRPSSRLRELIDGFGQIYALQDFLWCWDTVGQINWGGNTSPQKFRTVIQTICQECFQLCRTPLDQSELDLIKRNMEIRAVYRFDDPFETANFLAAEHLNRGSCVLMPDYLQRIQSLTPGDLQRVANRVFVPERLSLMAAGPLDGLGADQIRQFIHP